MSNPFVNWTSHPMVRAARNVTIVKWFWDLDSNARAQILKLVLKTDDLHHYDPRVGELVEIPGKMIVGLACGYSRNFPLDDIVSLTDKLEEWRATGAVLVWFDFVDEVEPGPPSGWANTTAWSVLGPLDGSDATWDLAPGGRMFVQYLNG